MHYVQPGKTIPSLRPFTIPAHAHGIDHTRPIVARGVHFNAENEPQPGDLTEADLAEIDAQFGMAGAMVQLSGFIGGL